MMIASCNEPRTGGDAWKNSFSSDEGILFGAAIGYRFENSRFRVELEYFYRDTGYEETSTIDFGADPQTVAKINNELLVVAERIDSLISHTCLQMCTWISRTIVSLRRILGLAPASR